jgi:hypothetical protein
MTSRRALILTGMAALLAGVVSRSAHRLPERNNLTTSGKMPA